MIGDLTKTSEMFIKRKKYKTRIKLLKMLGNFVETEWVFANDTKDTTAKAKKRINNIVKKIMELKKQL